jgi:hypothetical protein
VNVRQPIFISLFDKGFVRTVDRVIGEREACGQSESGHNDKTWNGRETMEEIRSHKTNVYFHGIRA